MEYSTYPIVVNRFVFAVYKIYLKNINEEILESIRNQKFSLMMLNGRHAVVFTASNGLENNEEFNFFRLLFNQYIDFINV